MCAGFAVFFLFDGEGDESPGSSADNWVRMLSNEDKISPSLKFASGHGYNQQRQLEVAPQISLSLLSSYNDPKPVVKKSGQRHDHHLAPDGTPATDFIFLVAIEGSGHHINQALFEKSPAMERITKLRVQPLVRDVLESLYKNKDKSNGLFSAPSGTHAPDGASIVAALVKKLRIVDARIGEASFPGSTMVPLNAGGIALGTTGMMSYTNFLGRDRALQYPDIHALYHACDAAGVSCRHVILTRDPYAVIRSTTMNREFSSKHQAIQLYTAMLDVIFAQMLAHPDRLAACWEYGNVANEELGALMGWDRGGSELSGCVRVVVPGRRGNEFEREVGDHTPRTGSVHVQYEAGH